MKILTTFAKTRCDVGKFLITPDGNISYYTKKYNILNNMFKLILDYCCRFNFYIFTIWDFTFYNSSMVKVAVFINLFSFILGWWFIGNQS